MKLGSKGIKVDDYTVDDLYSMMMAVQFASLAFYQERALDTRRGKAFRALAFAHEELKEAWRRARLTYQGPAKYRGAADHILALGKGDIEVGLAELWNELRSSASH